METVPLTLLSHPRLTGVLQTLETGSTGCARVRFEDERLAVFDGVLHVP